MIIYQCKKVRLSILGVLFSLEEAIQMSKEQKNKRQYIGIQNALLVNLNTAK